MDFENQNKETLEVYLSTEKTFSLSSKDILKLKQMAGHNPRRRIRFCSHLSTNELVHEMFIIHPKGSYIRPHKHIGKAESMLIIKGEVDYVIFNDSGDIKDIITMGDYQSDKCFYQSIQTNVYHSLIIKSEWLIFLEVTEGPFERIKTLYASWSPDESDTKSVKIFMDYLKTSFP